MNWDWVSFIIGVLVGLLIAWLIDYFFLRSRRGDLQEANVALQARLDQAQAGQSDLQGQLSRCQDSLSAREDELASVQAQLESAQADAQAAAVSVQESLAAQEQAAADCAAALKAKEDELAEVESALEALRAEQAAAETRAQDLATRLAAAEAAIPVEPQDLTRIEGIGPAIAGLLNNAGIVNYAQLAGAALDRLHEILQAAGPRFHIANPTSWPQQARLAAEEKWDELDALQGRLTAGRITGEPEDA